ncbi:MAG: hypothetical protein JW931_08910 [Methanomicrobiaceae archaeon]|nr:hypothetical protein [Methanomicrobiaceae archaeon]
MDRSLISRGSIITCGSIIITAILVLTETIGINFSIENYLMILLSVAAFFGIAMMIYGNFKLSEGDLL